LWLRPQHLLLLRVTSLRLLNLILPALLTFSLHLRLGGRALLLLRLNCLLSLSFTLLPLKLSLILRPSGLPNRLALCLHTRAWQCSRIYLLPAQLLHLLTSVAVAMSCLSGELSHLALARLLGRDVRLLSCLARGRCSLIRDLQVLSSRLSCDWLNA